MKYFKTTDESSQLIRLDNSDVKVSGEEITKTEYDMTRVGLKIFINEEDVERIKSEDWWK